MSPPLGAPAQPVEADVAIIGAAIHFAEAGARCIVIDAAQPGWGELAKRLRDDPAARNAGWIQLAFTRSGIFAVQRSVAKRGVGEELRRN